MKAAQFASYGKTQDVVKIVDIAKPTPKEGEILVQVKAAALNPVDFKLIHGYLKSWFDILPFVTGLDFAGVVAEAGSGVTKFQVGDEVYGKAGIVTSGAVAEYLLIKESALLIKKPANVNFGEAASIPLAALTSYQALVKGGIKAGQKVLILGGSGGTGAFGIQIAKILGAHVTATTSGKNTEFVKGLGADEVVDYTLGDYGDQLKGHHFDLIYDTVGGGYPSASKVSQSGTQFVSIAGAAPSDVSQDLPFLDVRLADTLSDLESLNNWVKDGSLKPVIDKSYPFQNTVDAFLHLESGRARGKVVITF